MIVHVLHNQHQAGRTPGGVCCDFESAYVWLLAWFNRHGPVDIGRVDSAFDLSYVRRQRYPHAEAAGGRPILVDKREYRWLLTRLRTADRGVHF